ncbi:MAG: hypothetical protein GY722_24695 [bacterium]|nr:hypothetical protein [bacterium]
MKTNSIWIWLTILAIAVTVLIMSMGSPELQFGDDPVVINIGIIMDWFWGLVGAIGVLRLTMFRRPTEAGWGQDNSWPWIFGVVAALWFAAAISASSLPVFELGDDIIIPVAAIVAPVAAAMLTWYACEFLVAGFAARRGNGTT